MILNLTAEQWRKVEDFQAAEMTKIIEDGAHDLRMAMTPHFAEIGSWLTEGDGALALEIGCGPGRYVALLHSLGYRVIAADPSRYPSWELIAREGITFHDGVVAEELPYQDESFDAVACMGALLYFKDAGKAFAEMRRVLKPGGRLVVKTINRTNLFRLVRGRNLDPATVNVYTERELASELDKHGFDVARTSSYGFYSPWFEARWWLAVNGQISLGTQQILSSLCPRRYRMSVHAYATRR
jgi:ubiquinone/menaquinone biosynthesis C-methylase UbiE